MTMLLSEDNDNDDDGQSWEVINRLLLDAAGKNPASFIVIMEESRDVIGEK